MIVRSIALTLCLALLCVGSIVGCAPSAGGGSSAPPTDNLAPPPTFTLASPGTTTPAAEIPAVEEGTAAQPDEGSTE